MKKPAIFERQKHIPLGLCGVSVLDINSWRTACIRYYPCYLIAREPFIGSTPGEISESLGATNLFLQLLTLSGR
jgi:hypothetical protein